MKIYVGLYKVVAGGIVAETHFFQSGSEGITLLDLVEQAQNHDFGDDDVVTCPNCNSVMVFTSEEEAITAVRKGCSPCCD